MLEQRQPDQSDSYKYSVLIARLLGWQCAPWQLDRKTFFLHEKKQIVLGLNDPKTKSPHCAEYFHNRDRGYPVRQLNVFAPFVLLFTVIEHVYNDRTVELYRRSRIVAVFGIRMRLTVP